MPIPDNTHVRQSIKSRHHLEGRKREMGGGGGGGGGGGRVIRELGREGEGKRGDVTARRQQRVLGLYCAPQPDYVRVMLQQCHSVFTVVLQTIRQGMDASGEEEKKNEGGK
jgi:hypothetical protein